MAIAREAGDRVLENIVLNNMALNLLEEVLVADRNNLTAWELLFHVAHTDKEKTFCLKAILPCVRITLGPDNNWL